MRNETPNPFLALDIFSIIQSHAKNDPDSVEAQIQPRLRKLLAEYLAYENLPDELHIRRRISEFVLFNPQILKPETDHFNQQHLTKAQVVP